MNSRKFNPSSLLPGFLLTLLSSLLSPHFAHFEAISSAHAGSCKIAEESIEKTFASRNAALRQAKRDAGIPMDAQPLAIDKTPLTALRSEGGADLLYPKGHPLAGQRVMTREYIFEVPAANGQPARKIVIQEHTFGHGGHETPHFNVRPFDNRRTGKVAGTQEHYDIQLTP